MHFLAPGVVLLIALAACGRDARPDQPPATSAPAPRASGPALPGTAAYACPGIDQLDTSGGRVCTEMGCMSGFSLTLFPNGGWPHGKYRFVIKRDATTTTCEGSLPLPPCGQAAVHCDGEGVGVAASGCALAPDGQSFADIGFEGYPALVDVDVFRDDVLLAHAHYGVKYTLSQPNGKGCSPACCSAVGALTLPPP